MGVLFKKLILRERGSALVIVSLALMMLLGITGVVIDGGTLYITKSHLKKAANAAALSGAQELTHNQEIVKGIVQEVLRSHKEETSLVNIAITKNQKVRVHLKKEVPVTFLKLLGLGKIPVEAAATAQILQMGRAAGAAPLGIDESISLEFYKTYKLKVDQTEVDTGYFGILALGGTGAQTYEDNLRFGYQQEIESGHIIETQTGNVAGKTRTVINDLIDACPYPTGDFNHRDCPRILLVPVYQPYEQFSSQLKKIKVTGFAYFYVLEPMTSNATYIKGMFIPRVGTGFGDSHSVNKGAYSIKLTE